MDFRPECMPRKEWNKNLEKCVDKRNLVLEFDTDLLLSKFNLPSFDLDPTDFYTEIPYSYAKEIKKKYCIEDCDDTEIYRAIYDEQFNSYADIYTKTLINALESYFDKPTGHHFEYYAEDDEKYYVGEMEGIEYLEMNWDKTYIEVKPEFLHTLNALMGGQGYFSPISGKNPQKIISKDATLKEWMEGHIHNIKYFPGIYGEYEPDFEQMMESKTRYGVDFNEENFKELLKEYTDCKIKC